MQAPNDCPAPGDVVSADRTAPSVPPSTLDFLLPLRNNFRDIIVPRLPQEAKDAILMQKDPKDMTDIERKRTRFAILGAVYGKQSVLGRECILWGCCEHSLVDGRVYTVQGGGGEPWVWYSGSAQHQIMYFVPVLWIWIRSDPVLFARSGSGFFRIRVKQVILLWVEEKTLKN